MIINIDNQDLAELLAADIGRFGAAPHLPDEAATRAGIIVVDLARHHGKPCFDGPDAKRIADLKDLLDANDLAVSTEPPRPLWSRAVEVVANIGLALALGVGVWTMATTVWNGVTVDPIAEPMPITTSTGSDVVCDVANQDATWIDLRCPLEVGS